METNGNKKYKCSQTCFFGTFFVTENGLTPTCKKVLILWKHFLKMSKFQSQVAKDPLLLNNVTKCKGFARLKKGKMPLKMSKLWSHLAKEPS
jgi:hypothetical protein